MDELFITQIGLLLSQFRYTRRALEDIERSTARYGGVTFAVALAAGPRFGEPPLMGGALKVYITNINELTVGRGAIGLIEGLLGGVGRFLGGLGGGFAGGLIGGVSLWVWVGKLQDIVKGINQIMDRLGIVGDKAKGTAGAGADDGDKGKGDWPAALERLDPILKSLTALFDAAARGPEEAGKTASQDMTEDARAWGQQLATALTASVASLGAATQLLKGITILMPMLIGVFALLLTRLDNIKLAILELLQFALRVTLLLRGAALVTIFDTISVVAKLGSAVLLTLQTAATSIIGAVLEMLGGVLGTVEALFRFVGSGLASAMNGLLAWLVGGLGRVLTFLGGLRIFQLVTHLVQVLPSMLPALVTLVNGNDASVSQVDMLWLDSVRNKPLPGPGPASLGGTLPADVKFPDLGAKLLETVQPFKDKLQQTRDMLPDQTGKAFDAARTALTGIDAHMQDALTSGETGFEKKLEKHLGTVKAQAESLAGKLTPAVEGAAAAVKAGEGDAGLRAIAQAYEGWLKADGLKNVLAEMTGFFAQAGTPNADKGAAAVVGAVLGTARPDAPRASVEIGELVIELEQAKPVKDPKGKKTASLDLWHDAHPNGYDELLERGAA
jgi:hypothetical protein